jgi:hypothetical protein
MHDAEFDPDMMKFDPVRGVVEIEFEQEPRDLASGIPASALVRSTVPFEEYAVPFLRYRFVAQTATELRCSDDVKEAAYELTAAEFAAKADMIRVQTNWGWIEIPVAQLNVTLEITDEIVTVRRRRVGRRPRWDSTTRWHGEQQDRMRALVLEPHDAPALHEVSAIVRPPP